MFTGIIEETGTIKNIKKGITSVILTIECKKIFEDLKLGDSVATNGICLTVKNVFKNTFVMDVMNETLLRSTLGSLNIGSKVNLERALSINARFGGHIVSGHIDGTGKIISIKKEDIATWYTIKCSKNIMRYVVEKGSITIDGISLTVTNVKLDSFCVSVIPHTAKETTLSEKVIGDLINLENDIIGKYIEKFTQGNNGISKDFLQQYGF